MQCLMIVKRECFWVFIIFFRVIFNTASSDSTVPTDAGIEPRTVANGALAVRRLNSNDCAISRFQNKSSPLCSTLSNADETKV
jgi:hypothetical protein